MECSNPRDDRAERNRGSAEVPLSTVIPRVGNFHLEKNTILDSFSFTTTPQIWFISRFCVFFGALSLGENTWVRCNFITQAKNVAISVWCARNNSTLRLSDSAHRILLQRKERKANTNGPPADTMTLSCCTSNRQFRATISLVSHQITHQHTRFQKSRLYLPDFDILSIQYHLEAVCRCLRDVMNILTPRK